MKLYSEYIFLFAAEEKEQCCGFLLFWYRSNSGWTGSGKRWRRILFPEFSLPLFLGAKSPYEPVDPSLTRLVRHQGV